MEPKNSTKQLIERISELSEQMGYDPSAKTIYSLQAVEESGAYKLTPKEGGWSDEKPIFVYDEQNPERVYVLLSQDHFANLLKTLRSATQENFNLKLEKAIWKHTPIDFQDVWVVAIDKIRRMVEEAQKDNAQVNINLDDVVGQIKREHPSLFIDLTEVVRNATLQ